MANSPMPHDHQIDEGCDRNSASDQHLSPVLSNGNGINEVVQRTSTLSLSMRPKAPQRRTNGAAQVTAEIARKNASQRRLNTLPPPKNTKPNPGGNSAYLYPKSSAQKTPPIPRESLARARNGGSSQQKKSVWGYGGSIPQAARFQADVIPTIARTTLTAGVKGGTSPPPSSSRPTGHSGSVSGGRAALQGYSERITQCTPSTARKYQEGCSSTTAPNTGGGNGNSTGPGDKQQQGGDCDKSTLTPAISASITGTVPPERERQLPMNVVFLSLKRIWQDILVKMGPSNDPHLMSVRFSCWGKVYFSNTIREVDAEEDVKILLNNVFCSIAQQLAGCTKQLGMEKESADWGVVNAFVGEVKREMGVDNDNEMALEAEDEGCMEKGKGKERDGESDPDKGEEDEKGGEHEENHENRQGLKPLIENLKDLVGILESLCSTLVMGRSLKR